MSQTPDLDLTKPSLTVAQTQTDAPAGAPGPCPVTGEAVCFCGVLTGSSDAAAPSQPEEEPGTAEPDADALARDDDISVIPVAGMLHVCPSVLLANDGNADATDPAVPLEIVSLEGAVRHGDQIMVEDPDGDGVAQFVYTVSDGTREETATVTLRVWKPQTPQEIDAFVEAAIAAPEHGGHQAHGGDELKASEHDTLLELVPRDQATHIAVRDGDWSDPETWWEGRVPGDGADVLIPAGMLVTVDGENDARLSTIRVDGMLTFAPDTDTRLIVETLVTTPGSRLEIGSEAVPVSAAVEAQIVIHAATPGQLPEMSMARGVVTHGEVAIHGAEKLSHTVLAGGVSAGATEITLAEAPTGWQLGDKLVLAGTSYNPEGSDADNSRFRDEVLTITEIDGTTIRFVNEDTGGTALRFDHRAPEGYEDRFEIPIANITRNVTVMSENGKDTDIPDRGHVMFMHSNDVVVKHASFVGLGRSDKDELVDDPGLNVDGGLGPDGTELGLNPRGRYAVHLHRLGVEAVEEGDDPALIEGISVVGSPGWGIVHHDSRAVLNSNVTFDILGSAIVAEAGNETGRWENNLTIKTTGDDRPQIDFDGSARVPVFDFGFNGEGFWLQGAPLIEMVDNTAVSSNGAGLEIFTDVDGNRNKDVNGAAVAVATLAPAQRDVFLAAGYDLTDMIDIRAAISPGVTGFTAINSFKGIETWNHMRNDDGVLSFFGGHGHALRSEISDFELWGIFGEGIFTQYSTQIDFRDGVIVGAPDDPVEFRPGINGGGVGRGIGSNGPAHDLVYENIEIDGFEVGLRLPKEAGSFGGPSVPYFDFNGTEVTGLTVSNVASVFGNTQATWADPEPFPNFIALEGLSLGDGVPTGALPVPAFTAETLGGAGVVAFDGSPSVDTDWNPIIRTADNAIAAYGWDFDRDGEIDQYGRWVRHDFGAPGTYEVDLTVWDSDGQSASVTQSVEVVARAYDNLLLDGGFDAPLEASPWYAINPSILGQGWKTSGWQIERGAASAPQDTPINNGVQQVLLDNYARQGLQDFTFDLDYNYFSDNEGRYLDVAIWGFDTEFKHKAGDDGIDGEGAIPMDGTLLYYEEFGDTQGWEEILREIDFGDGYKFVTVSFQFDGRFGDGDAIRRGDAIRIDNVSITDAARFEAPDPDPEPEPEPEPEPTPAEELVLAVNIGGSAHTGMDGIAYAADEISDGFNFSIPAFFDISGTEDDTRFRSEAWKRGRLDYEIPLPDGSYRVELDFAEIWIGARAEGRRVFDVTAEGREVVADLDLAGSVGFRTATTEVFEVTVADGALDLVLEADTQNPKLSAMRIYRSDGAAPAADPQANPRLSDLATGLLDDEEATQLAASFAATEGTDQLQIAGAPGAVRGDAEPSHSGTDVPDRLEAEADGTEVIQVALADADDVAPPHTLSFAALANELDADDEALALEIVEGPLKGVARLEGGRIVPSAAEPANAAPDDLTDPAIEAYGGVRAPAIGEVDLSGGAGLGYLAFFIADSTTDETLAEIVPGRPTIDAALPDNGPTTLFALPAEGSPEIGSVRLSFGEHVQTETLAPYALYGDWLGNLRGDAGFEPGGKYDIGVEIFAGPLQGGALLDSFTLEFQL
ncbi:MAG: malectin domain-containing carbohydrate-binding protein [Pikeienuella sp.]